jgi:hypothetical protein
MIKARRAALMYVYYNPNPAKKSAGDCVIRALCKAFEADWESIYAALSVQGYMMHDWGNSDPVWGAYLRSKGFVRYVLPNTCPDCYTIEDFARDHKKGTYILGTGRHAAAVVDGVIYDSWNSSGEVPIFYFERSE